MSDSPENRKKLRETIRKRGSLRSAAAKEGAEMQFIIPKSS